MTDRHEARIVALLACLVALMTCAPALAEQVTLQIWTNWGWANKNFQELSAIYEAKHPGVKIEWRSANLNNTAGIEKLLLNVAAGTAPDVVTFTDKGLAELGSQGLLEPIDPYVNRSGLHKKFHPAVWTRYSMNGRIYGLPALEGGPGAGLIFNKRLLAERGLPAPDSSAVMTWDELGQMARRLNVVKGDGTVEMVGYYPPQTGGMSLATIPPAFNTDWLDRKTGLAVLDRPEIVAAFETLKRNFYDPLGFAAIEAALAGYNRWTNNANNLFVREKTAMLISGYYSPGELRTTMPGGEWGVTWMPNNDRLRVQTVAGWALFMMKDSKQKEAAWDFMQFVSSPEATKVIYESLGWLGGLHTDLPRYIDVRNHPDTLWYINSLSQADAVRTEVPNLWKDAAGQHWSTVYRKVMSGEGSAATLLTEANRVLNAQIKEAARK